MASYRSQFNRSARSEDQLPYPSRTTTRLPQRSITPVATAQVPAAKLQKRSQSRDGQIDPNRRAGGQRERGPPPQASVTARRQGSTTPTVPPTHVPHLTTLKTSIQTSSRPLKLEVPENTRTPSLVSGSSASTIDSPRSNVLKKKQSSIGTRSQRQQSRTRDLSTSSSDANNMLEGIPGGYKDPFSETVLGISLPPATTVVAPSDANIELPYHAHYDFEIGPTDMLPPPAPQYALSTTPSTHYSESPGPFSISSTPTSMSSYSHSPATSLPSKASFRMRQTSPLQGRPPIARLRTPDDHALSSVRESSTSSSSTTTEKKSRERSERAAAPSYSQPTKATSTRALPLNQTRSTSYNTSRRPSQTAEEKPRIQAPPELAHLADQPPAAAGARRPSRPSRDGTSEILGLRGPSPIVQSNMSSFPSPHKRTPSTDSAAAFTVAGKTRFGIPSKASSRNPSPSPNLQSAPFSRIPTRGNTPEVPNELERQRSQTLPTPVSAPSPSKSSKFSFFSRRTKTEPSTASAPKKEKKLHRRGPAAGTGHEGYGRYALRGRSGSTASTTSVGRSASAGTTRESLERTPSTRKSSVTSTTSSDVDDYFLDRLTPIVIRGAGSSTELTRSPEPMQSTSSLDVSIQARTVPKATTAGSARPALESTRPTLLPSAMSDPVRGMSPKKKPSLGSRRPSESDDDSKRSFIPSMASRRTSRMSKIADPTETSTTSYAKASRRARKDSVGDLTSDGKEGNWLKSSKKDKKEKSEKEAPKPPRKWNFFQRAHAVPRVATPAVEPITASPARAPASRSLAHYAPMGSQAGLGLEDIEQIMQEPDSSPEDVSAADEEIEKDIPTQIEPAKIERLQSMLLPPKPILPADVSPPGRAPSPKVFLHTEPMTTPQSKLTIDTSAHEPSGFPAPQSVADLTDIDLSPCSSRPQSPDALVEAPRGMQAHIAKPAQILLPPPSGPPPTTTPPRPSRLAQVGRIPQVISRRNQVHRPPSVSFSRPFATYQSRPGLPSRTSSDSVGPFTVTAGPESYPVLQGLNALDHSSAIATMSPSAEESVRRSEFFKFPPRKDSEVSYSSSSGIWSFPATAGTAQLPRTGAPQSEDEVWNEYDDLIDEVLSPIESNTDAPIEDPISKRPSLEPLPLRTKASKASSQSAGLSLGVSVPSLHLRRSRLLAVLHSQSPTSPISLSDYLQERGENTISVVDPVTGRLSFPSTVRMSTGSGSRKRASARSSLPASLNLSARQSKATLASVSDKDRESATAKQYRDSKLMEIAEAQADGLVSMANLRFGALMTSKWLSFGRVLFSPAHFELSNPNEDRVLVIDGLGRDWSYYCALTYPEATVYDLGPGASTTTPSSDGIEPWSTLSNHRHINHPSLSTAFPFPGGMFACVVMRFPPALPTAVHRFVVSECKRVLRPGGHLELSVLDLDLVNMGNRARRAVRGLKVKMQVADENVSLRNISDEMMNLLGRKGFTECNRCFVGVPVAGTLPSSNDSNASPGKKRKGSTASSIGRRKGSAASTNPPKPEVSFSELLNKHASTDSTDTTITDMVARVGRWWYSRCYESLVLPEAGEEGAATSGNLLESSIWRDESLINECEKRGTSFRLLIGYAQKPEVGVRRTVSV